MPEQLKWTMQVAIGSSILVTSTEAIAVHAYCKLSTIIPAGSEDKAIDILPDDDGIFSLVAVKASKYVNPEDGNGGLRMKLAANGVPIALAGPLILTHGGMLDSLTSGLTRLYFANDTQSDVEIEVLACSHAIFIPEPTMDTLPVTPHAVMAPMQPEARTRDDLTNISGIGPVYQQRLYEAGIETYAALAAASVEQIREVFSLQPWQAARASSWIEQAQVLASQRRTLETDNVEQ